MCYKFKLFDFKCLRLVDCIQYFTNNNNVDSGIQERLVVVGKHLNRYRKHLGFLTLYSINNAIISKKKIKK